MIEKKIVGEKVQEYRVAQFLRDSLKEVPIAKIELEKNPLGERVTIYTSAPGLVIGREGVNIKRLTAALKSQFNYENPQIKIGEVTRPNLSAAIVAKTIANNMSNFGLQKFKLTAFKAISGVMQAGAMGCEIRLTGKLPAARAKSWRFVQGYIKKTGYISDFVIDHAIDSVLLKTGVVGIKVSIMLPETQLPDKVKYIDEMVAPKVVEAVSAPKPKNVHEVEGQ
jgi:small subunit ribosomal protein S3